MCMVFGCRTMLDGSHHILSKLLDRHEASWGLCAFDQEQCSEGNTLIIIDLENKFAQYALRCCWWWWWWWQCVRAFAVTVHRHLTHIHTHTKWHERYFIEFMRPSHLYCLCAAGAGMSTAKEQLRGKMTTIPNIMHVYSALVVSFYRLAGVFCVQFRCNGKCSSARIGTVCCCC